MSWINSACEAYDYISSYPSDKTGKLIPIAHSTQNAQIQITIDENGNFVNAATVSDKEEATLIPVTEKSSSRSGASKFPHPLCDKLEYIAPELDSYIKSKKSSREKFNIYIEQLDAWCDSQFSHKKACAIRDYLKKENVIKDLIESGILYLDENGKLMEKWSGDKDTRPEIFTKTSPPQQSFVRFRVTDTDSNVSSAVCEDESLIKKYIRYYESTKDEYDIDFSNGEECIAAYNHSSKLRNTGDKAKIISSNDSSGFTFRGRFRQAEQVAQIGFETSQKAHNALKYLIKKQGTTVGTKTVLLFGTKNSLVPDLMCDTKHMMEIYGDQGDQEEETEAADTKEEIAVRFNMMFAGYRGKYIAQADEKLVLLVLSSATTGRMSINYYREFIGEDKTELIDCVESWHRHIAWKRSFKDENKKPVFYVGAPAPKEIAEVAFGTQQGNFVKADEKIVGQTVLRILPCISEGRKIPRDIVNSAVRKSHHPQNYSSGNWNYKVLPAACSLMKKYLYDYERNKYAEIFDEDIINKKNEEEWKMGLKPDCKDLAYNCGRLLCMADYIERSTYGSDEKGRVTNAMRYYTQFAQHPCRTWQTIDRRLSVYINKLGGSDNYHVGQLRKIEAEIDPEEFANARNLDGKMSLGFGAQREFIFTKKEKVND